MVELRRHLHFAPPVPVVFTSRTAPASFRAEADEGEGFTFPGAISWTAQAGRLRLIDPQGRLYELTWGRPLPDGGTLIDVMSPCVSLDGTKVLFAGRQSAPDPGRWRIYQVDLDGQGLRQLTGGPDDPGCILLPPLRFAADGSRLADSDRRRIDYDDVDPIDLGSRGFAFASSRIPDLGRDQARRATQIWVWPTGAASPFALTANRNNDRWPALTTSDTIVYSLWSRIREGVSADLSEVRPFSTGGRFVTEPAQTWIAGRVSPNAADVGYAVKSAEPVWRPRPLFNGRLAFMTDSPGEPGRCRLAQADWGYVRSAPSSLVSPTRFPDQGNARLHFGPDRDAQCQELSAGCPSPCPEGSVLLAAAPHARQSAERVPGAFGLYLTSDDWAGSPPPLRLLFDDPAFDDAEPVAVYPRAIREVFPSSPPLATARQEPETLRWVSGPEYRGPSGYLENFAVLDAIRNPIPWNPAGTGAAGAGKPASRVDPRKDPLIPPPKDVRAIAFYASHRDRFDDLTLPRIPGGFERLRVAELDSEGHLETWLPSDPKMPTVLAGLNADGKVVKWTGSAKDPAGLVSTYVAFAGDHYSGTRPHGYHYCNGCHAGHTFTALDLREKVKGR